MENVQVGGIETGRGWQLHQMKEIAFEKKTNYNKNYFFKN
jgi:hypothetical protein